MVDLLQWEEKIPDNYPDDPIKFRCIGYVKIKEIRYNLIEIIIERCCVWDWLNLIVYNKKNMGEDYMDKFESIRLDNENVNEFNSNFSETFKDIIDEVKYGIQMNYTIPKELSRILKIENILNG